MAKKKNNSSKKHKFKHVEAAPALQNDNVRVDADVAVMNAPRPVQWAGSGRDFGYVARDLRRIGIMVGSLVALELVIYYVLVFTSAGAAIYRLVNV